VLKKTRKDRKKNLRIAFVLLGMAGIVGGCGVHYMCDEYRIYFYVIAIIGLFSIGSILAGKIVVFLKRDSLSENKRNTKITTEVGKKYLEQKYGILFETERSMPGSRRRFDLFGRKNGLVIIGEIKTSLSDASRLCSQLVTYHKVLKNIPTNDKIWYAIISSNVLHEIMKKDDGLLDALRQLRLGKQKVNVLVVDTAKRKVHILENK